MNGIVDWMLAELWRYTVLTFRIFWWLFRFLTAGITRFLNGQQGKPPSKQDDLLNPMRKQ